MIIEVYNKNTSLYTPRVKYYRVLFTTYFNSAEAQIMNNLIIN